MEMNLQDLLMLLRSKAESIQEAAIARYPALGAMLFERKMDATHWQVREIARDIEAKFSRAYELHRIADEFEQAVTDCTSPEK